MFAVQIAECVFSLNSLGLWTPTHFFLSVSYSQKSVGPQSIMKWPDMTSSLYVIYVSGHYWMFAVQITEYVFSLKSLGLLTPTHPQFRTKS